MHLGGGRSVNLEVPIVPLPLWFRQGLQRIAAREASGILKSRSIKFRSHRYTFLIHAMFGIHFTSSRSCLRPALRRHFAQ